MGETVVGLFPKLRFPEFQRNPSWAGYLLEDLERLGWVQLGRGNVISAQDMKSRPGDYPVYSSSVKNQGYMGSYGEFMFDEELISWSVDGGGDFFYRPKHKFSVTNVSGYMRLDTKRLSYRFIAGYLQALHVAHTFDYQFKAHPSVIRKLYRVAIPELSEQQKIAECLGSLDELIGAEREKLDALKAYKKGLMQQLFPREGETVPRLRFPEFEGSGEWACQPLGELVQFQSGFAFSSDLFGTEGKKLVTPKNFTQSGFGHFDKMNTKYTTEDVSTKYICHPGDLLILLTDLTPTCELLGKPLEVRVSDGQVLLNQRIVKVEPVNPRVSREFLKQFFQTEYYSRIIKNTASGSTVRHSSNKILEGLEIKSPANVEEVNRISICLSTVDDLIIAQEEQTRILQTHKQGLMRQLFPIMEVES